MIGIGHRQFLEKYFMYGCYFSVPKGYQEVRDVVQNLPTRTVTAGSQGRLRETPG